MPSPIGHSLTGFALYCALEGPRRPVMTRSDMALCSLIVMAANLPDVDFLLNIVTGRNYHRGFTHSLLAVTVFALGVWVLSHICRRHWAGRTALLIGLGMLSHVLLDSLAADTVPPWELLSCGPSQTGVSCHPWLYCRRSCGKTRPTSAIYLPWLSRRCSSWH